jgi:hypothetical protein
MTLECRHLKLLWLYERDLGIAVGRVLAHEIGHALLGGPPFHDATGLMRANFRADDLTNFDPRLFRLSSESEARLRVRNAALLNVQFAVQSRVGSPDGGVLTPAQALIARAGVSMGSSAAFRHTGRPVRCSAVE